MKDHGTVRVRFRLSIFACFLWTLWLAAQSIDISDVPSRFKVDMQTAERLRPQLMKNSIAAHREMRQLSGCSPTTTVTFTIPDDHADRKVPPRWTDVYVIDAWGAVLARADLPKLPPLN